jgi:hypothetical protein
MRSESKGFVRRFYLQPETAYRIKDGIPPKEEREKNPGILECEATRAIDLPLEIDPVTKKRTSPMTYAQYIEWRKAHEEDGVEFVDLPPTGEGRNEGIAPSKR